MPELPGSGPDRESNSRTPLHNEHVNPAGERDLPPNLQGVLDGGTIADHPGNADLEEKEIRPQSEVHARLEALSPEQRREIFNTATGLMLDSFDRNEVQAQYEQVGAAVTAMTEILSADNVQAESEWGQILLSTARNNQIGAIVDSVPLEAPNTLEPGVEGSEQAPGHARRTALTDILSATPEEFDQLMEVWQTHDQLRFAAERALLQEEAQQIERAHVQGEGREARDAMARLNEGHDGLMGRIAELPGGWVALRDRIDNPKEGFEARLQQYRESGDREKEVSQLSGLVGAESSEELADMLFANKYASELLAGIVAAAAEANRPLTPEQTEQVLRDLRTMAPSKQARIDQETYMKHARYANMYQPASSAASQAGPGRPVPAPSSVEAPRKRTWYGRLKKT